MYKILILLVVCLYSCTCNDCEDHPCSHTLFDTRFKENDNYFYFTKGAYWVYIDSVAGYIDSQCVLENSFHDLIDNQCVYNYLRRDAKMDFFSSYYNSNITHNIISIRPNSVSGTYSLYVIIREPDMNMYWGYRQAIKGSIFADALYKDSTLLIKNRPYYNCTGFRTTDSLHTIEMIYSKNVGIIKKKVIDNKNNYVLNVWELDRYNSNR